MLCAISLTSLSEVESLIELAVAQAVSEKHELAVLRQDIVDKLVQALETDAAWVGLYGVTGELVATKVKMDADKLVSGLQRAMEVRSSYSFCRCSADNI